QGPGGLAVALEWQGRRRIPGRLAGPGGAAGGAAEPARAPGEGERFLPLSGREIHRDGGGGEQLVAVRGDKRGRDADRTPARGRVDDDAVDDPLPGEAAQVTPVTRDGQAAGAVRRDVRGQLDGHGVLPGAGGEGGGRRGRFAGRRRGRGRGISQQ